MESRGEQRLFLLLALGLIVLGTAVCSCGATASRTASRPASRRSTARCGRWLPSRGAVAAPSARCRPGVGSVAAPRPPTRLPERRE